MNDWKLRSKMYHMMTENEPRGDELENETIIERYDKNHIIVDAVSYPLIQTEALYYPGKSYAIAIIYAQKLSLDFHLDFFELLDDPELLGGNDPYFVRYSEDKKTYNEILSKFPFDLIYNPNKASENFKKTVQFYEKEFLFAEDTRQWLAAE